ncbi:MAG: class II aldolase/adducin family protein [Candidatus Tectomicrobia bacterium]|nr:class II aldolase/adducin family protein [Candidatus Tectomicrobia bacterium]
MTAQTLASDIQPPPHRFCEAEWQARVDLAAGYRLADRFGFSDIVWNHITARVPGSEPHFLINAFGLRYDEITASNLVKIDLDGNVVDGHADINVTGFVIHSAIHAVRDDVMCVMHAHSPAGLAVSALASGLQPVIQDAMMFYNRIAYHDYEGLSIDIGERQRLAEHLGSHKAMILRHHGLLTVGRTVGEAFMLMYYLERACQVQMQVLSSGEPLRTPPAEVCERAACQYEQFAPGKYEWPALVRLLDRDSPDYKT